MALTLFGMIFFAMAAVWIKPPAIIANDRFTATLLGGLRFGWWSDPAIPGALPADRCVGHLLQPKLGFSVPNAGFALNTAPLAAELLLHGLEIIIYSCLFYYVYSRVVKVVLVGPIRSVKKEEGKQKKTCTFMLPALNPLSFFH